MEANGDDKTIFTLSELTGAVRDTLEATFPETYWVRAETSDVRVNAASGHCYLEFIEKNPKTNRRNAGFTDEERAKFTELLGAGFTDTYRYFYPDRTDIYSWWSYRFRAREKNAGWRIDYFLTSKRLDDRLVSADIHTDIYDSDHCPVEVVLDL